MNHLFCLILLLLLLTPPAASSRKRERKHMQELRSRSAKEFTDPADSLPASLRPDLQQQQQQHQQNQQQPRDPASTAPDSPSTAPSDDYGEDDADERDERDGETERVKILGIAPTRSRRPLDSTDGPTTVEPVESEEEKQRLTSCPPCLPPLAPGERPEGGKGKGKGEGARGIGKKGSRDKKAITSLSALSAQAVQYFWQGELRKAYACTCNILLQQPANGLAQAIVWSIVSDPPVDRGSEERMLAAEASPEKGSGHPSRLLLANDVPANTLPSLSSLVHPSLIVAPAQDAPAVEQWEVLGPFPVGKMEIDADPTFAFEAPNDVLGDSESESGSDRFDPINRILSMSQSAAVPSELAHTAQGSVGFRSVRVSPGGAVGVTFPTPWQAIASALQSPLPLEFQAWARANTYIRTAGSYAVACKGVHTVYLRTSHQTRILHADVYHSTFSAFVDLPAGPVGLALPIRGVGQSHFACTITPAKAVPEASANTILVSTPALLPHLLTPLPAAQLHSLSPRVVSQLGLDRAFLLDLFAGVGSSANDNANVGTLGLLLSGHFMLPVSNSSPRPLALSFQLDPSYRASASPGTGAYSVGDWTLQLASTAPHSGPDSRQTLTLAPGQTLAVPLALTPLPLGRPAFLPCHSSAASTSAKNKRKEGFRFKVLVTPSRGKQVRATLTLTCRYQNQSFLFSYLAPDGAVAQSAVIFPLPTEAQRERWAALEAGSGNTAPARASSCNAIEGSRECRDNDDASSDSVARGQPVLLTLHGTGVSPLSHADSYKLGSAFVNKRAGGASADYQFGLPGFFTIAPSRFGAHNWEGVGCSSALASVGALGAALSRFGPTSGPGRASSDLTASRHVFDLYQGESLPQISPSGGILAGHSMGGHGALIMASQGVLFPSDDARVPTASISRRFTCLQPSASWLFKEAYGDANAFPSGYDAGSAAPRLVGLLMQALSEYHPPLLVGNMAPLRTHVRVGADDPTTHHWHSRRLHRLLSAAGAVSTYDEVKGKGHWWWDSDRPNDGGVLNDPKLRAFYRQCLADAAADVSPYIPLAASGTPGADSDSGNGGKSTTNANAKAIEAERLSSANESQPLLSRGCRRFTATVINPDAQQGICGVRVLTQLYSASLAIVRASCVADSSRSLPSAHAECTVSEVSNIERALLDPSGVLAPWVGASPRSKISATYHFKGNSLTLARPTEVCFDTHRRKGRSTAASQEGDAMFVCPPRAPLHGLRERLPETAGPIRGLYSRPFLVVYGTPPDSPLRTALRDLAVYLGNAHFTSHQSSVQVITDLEFKSRHAGTSAASSSSTVPNAEHSGLLFVGGPVHNKAAALIYDNSVSPATGNAGAADVDGANDSIEAASLGILSRGTVQFQEHEQGFSVGPHRYPHRDQGIIATFPLARRSPRSGGGAEDKNATTLATPVLHDPFRYNLGVVLHANSAEGYTHLTRLAWSVVPPMVRAPFAAYLPDYLVVDASIWGAGLGGVLAGGFWGHDWAWDESQSYSR